MTSNPVEDDAGQHRAPGQSWLRRLDLSEPVRLRLYAVLAPAVALALAYGLINNETVPMWLAFGGALLGVATTETTRAAVVSPATARTVALDAVDQAHGKTGQPVHPLIAASRAMHLSGVRGA